MESALFEIVNGKKRKSRACAVLHYSREDGYRIDISEAASANEVPAFFIPFIERNERSINDEWTRRWIEERICPPGRQNLGEVLSAHGLNEYDELTLLRSSQAMSSQDDFIVREITPDADGESSSEKNERRRIRLGSQIRNRREALGLSQSDLARRLGMNQPYLSRIEAGGINITFDILADIAKELQLDSLPVQKEIAAPLWTAERVSLKKSLHDLATDLEVVYERLINEIEGYSPEGRTAVADSVVIAHCFRELIRLLPEYMADSSKPKGRQNEERDALKRLSGSLDTMPVIELDTEKSHYEIPADLYADLLNYKKARIKGNRNADQQISGILRTDDATPSMALITLNRAYSLGQSRAHLHRNYANSLPDKGEYIEHLALLEKTLKTQLDSIFNAKRALDDILNRANRVDSRGTFESPSERDVSDAMSIMDAARLEAAFFGKLMNPLWLQPLKKEGVFRNYKKAVERDDVIELFLPEPYLKRCISDKPKVVLGIMRELCATGHPLFRRFMAENAMLFSMPYLAEVAAELNGWAKAQYRIGDHFWNAERLAPLVIKLLDDQDRTVRRLGLTLFQNLIAFDRQATEAGMRSTYTSCCIPYYQYERFVAEIAPHLTAGERFGISKNRITAYIEQFSLFSYTRYALPSLNPDRLKSSLRRPEYVRPWISILSTSVRDEILKKTGKVLPAIKRAENEPAVRRVIFHAIHVTLEETRDRSSDFSAYCASLLSELFREDYLFNSEYEEELLPLLQDYSKIAEGAEIKEFSTNLPERIREWQSHRYESLRKEFSGPGAQKEALSDAENLEHMILSQFAKGKLSSAARRRLATLDRKYGKYSPVEGLYEIHTITGPNSPITSEKMLKMGPDNFLNYLFKWKPTEQDRFNLIEKRGVSHELSTLISDHPLFFAGHSKELLRLDFIYLDGLLDGWRTALKNGEPVPYLDAIEVCTALSRIPDEAQTNQTRRHRNSNVYMTKIFAVHFAQELLHSKAFSPSASVMQNILDILISFATIPVSDDSAADYEDCATAALNELRPLAISCIAEWLMRCSAKTNHVALAYDTLTTALPTETNSAADVLALSEHIPSLFQSTHQSWIQSILPELFGNEDPAPLQKIALSTILTFCPPSQNAFSFLLPVLERIPESEISSYPSCLDERREGEFALSMGRWIYLAILRGDLDIKDNVFLNWYSGVDNESKALTLGRCCAALSYRANIDDTAMDAIKALWDFHSSHTNDSYAPVSGALNLYQTGLFDIAWIKEALIQEASTPLFHNLFIVDEDSLIEIAAADPAWAVLFLQQLLKSDPKPERYTYSDIAAKMLDLYKNSEVHTQDEVYSFVREKMARMGVINLD